MNPQDELTLPDATPELLMQTKLQIEKDLGLTGFVYNNIDQPVDLPCMIPDLAEKLLELKQSGSSDLMKIIYRVDLTERQYKKVSLMKGDWHLNMAKAIILREFQKIYIRKKFSP